MRTTCLAAACWWLVACEREQPATAAPPAATAAPAATQPETPPAPATKTPALEDVVETTSQYVVGISYPPVASKYPGLAAELQRYADATRADLMQAVGKRKDEPGAPLYDLTLAFTEVLDSPELVAIAADGSTFTGGENSRPLVARFVWLPKENRLLTAGELVPDSASWNQIAADVRRQLQTALAQRAEADGLPPAERAALIERAARRIERGTAPDAKHFSMFEPVLAPSGKLAGVRFVFPAEQLDTGLHGTQTVEVPAHVLLPHVAPKYRSLFGTATG
ncbi:hypothetical protein ACFFGH_07430 [Lysobacter korlensis]|uniref:DUF3298 domain-containing protein n=1 Tax=Lysobacter korlensis TaxID=553636 RepID=A0ABV6RL32_9GAMM